MKTLKITLIATIAGTAAGLAAWFSGLGSELWLAHAAFADFLVTLVTTLVVQIAWPLLPQSRWR